jgi:glucan biosynthesis protein
MQVGPERVTQLIHVLAGIKAEANPAVILGSTDQSPYAMAQLYQFLASGGEIQPLHAVRGYRALFDVVPTASTDPIELRLYLSCDGQSLTETWLYQWVPPVVAERTLY